MCEVLISAYTARAVTAGLAAGACGAGLIRTEMIFARAVGEPSAAEQAAAYRQVLEPLAGLPAVVRVWDIGGDKAFRFARAAVTQNPALGERGIRHVRREPGLLDRQLAAIIEAAAAAGVAPAVMAPMVSLPEEAAWFTMRARRHGAAAAGVMIEVPSAVMMAPEIMSVADFTSIGTNDLLQYAHAVDRTASGPLADLMDPWQPALLRLMELVMAAARAGNRPVQVCGEAPADPAFAVVATGLGAQSVSVRLDAVAAVRAALEAAGPVGCLRAYEAAAGASDSRAARAAVAAVLDGAAA